MTPEYSQKIKDLLDEAKESDADTEGTIARHLSRAYAASQAAEPKE